MRLLLILSMLGLGLGCSSAPSSKCTTSTCSGCCDATGTCLPGTTESGCGSGGLTCTQCGADSFCNVGFCTPRGSSNLGGGTGTGGGSATGGGGGVATGGGGGSSSCGPQTCAGCCSNGVCQPGNQAAACGSGGQACTACSGACTDNQCAGSTCNPGNCQGCCNGNRCETGLTTTTCGAGGQICSACGVGESCTAGRCSGGSTCSPESCPDGCCQGDVCQVGTSTSACGAGGLTCGVCASGQTCSAGRCSGGNTCNATTCPSGCCAGNVCQPGTSTSACGAGGGACGACSGLDQCVGGRCQYVCNATTCPSGCCAGNVCQPGTSTSACGTGGGECASCGTAETCNGTQCVSSCNASTCPSGCCQGSVCQAGTSNAACGTGGAACASCSGTQACNGTSCAATCNSTTCPSGCCQGDVCQPGTSSSACGAGGATCNLCSGSQTCTGQACTGGGLPGDTCDNAPLLTLPFTVSQSLVGYANDFVTTSTTCRATQGLDRVTRVSVPAGQRLTVTLTPTVSTFDPALSLVTGLPSACAGSSATCVAQADVGNANAAETTSWTNTSPTAVTVFIIVDDYSATGTNGAYTLSASVATPTAGENCASPLSATSGVSISRTPSSFSDDYQGTGTGCLTPSVGPDFVLAYTVPNNQSLTVTATPGSGLDVSVNFATSLAACGSRTCVAAGSSGAAGVAETVAWNNTTGATVTVFVIVDTPASPSGSVSVLGTVGALLACGASTCPNGCCSAGTCVAGTSNSACGTGGIACSACSSPAQCSASQTCSATDLDTGSPCTASTQCYQPVLGTAECRTSWPGGYCTGTCLFTEQACGGIILNSGWCTPAGECLLECANPGGGQSTCRTGYVCDFSNGTGSQGVCIPRCQQVACASGTCNAAGYCR